MTSVISANPSTTIQKVKIHVAPGVRIEPCFQVCMYSVLDMLQAAASHYHVADKGHKHTNGDSEICFFIDVGKTCNTASQAQETFEEIPLQPETVDTVCESMIEARIDTPTGPTTTDEDNSGASENFASTLPPNIAEAIGLWMKAQMEMLPLQISQTISTFAGPNENVIQVMRDTSAPYANQVKETFRDGFNSFVNTESFGALNSAQRDNFWTIFDREFESLWPKCCDEAASLCEGMLENTTALRATGQSAGSHQRSSSLPRDIDLTNRLNSPRKKKSKKR